MHHPNRRGPVAAVVLAASLGCGSEPAAPFDCDQHGALCTVVGNGVTGFNGNDLPAEEVTLYWPTAVRFLPSGDPLVVDFNNQRVLVLEQGRVHHAAGTGFNAPATHEGYASELPLQHPVDVAPDRDGGFFLAEQTNGRILHVDAGGWLTLVLDDGVIAFDQQDAPAPRVVLEDIAGLALSGDGDTLFVADTATHRILAIDLPGRAAAWFAGDGSPGSRDGALETARFSGPRGLAWDGSGLLVADADNHRIRRVDVDAGTVTTVAGTGRPGRSGDGGPALDAELDTPAAIDVGPDGAIYLSDTGSSLIRRIDRHGVIDTVAGIGVAGEAADTGFAVTQPLATPWGVAVGPDHRVWIADTNASRVRVLVP